MAQPCFAKEMTARAQCCLRVMLLAPEEWLLGPFFLHYGTVTALGKKSFQSRCECGSDAFAG